MNKKSPSRIDMLLEDIDNAYKIILNFFFDDENG